MFWLNSSECGIQLHKCQSNRRKGTDTEANWLGLCQEKPGELSHYQEAGYSATKLWFTKWKITMIGQQIKKLHGEFCSNILLSLYSISKCSDWTQTSVGYNFNARATGNKGLTQKQIDKAYARTSLENSVTIKRQSITPSTPPPLLAVATCRTFWCVVNYLISIINK